MIESNFSTDKLFTGGAGLFLQYHDVIKPVYLYAIIKMILTNSSFGLPIELIKNMTLNSILEWYIKRRYINPLISLDYQKILDKGKLDELLLRILNEDESLYKFTPSLNIQKMIGVYQKQHMSFPIYVYTEHEEHHVLKDCNRIFTGVQIKYVYGDINPIIKKIGNNFTYILSDINLLKSLSILLVGSLSHILLTSEYRYNYIDNNKTFKINLSELETNTPGVKFGTTVAFDVDKVMLSFKNIIQERRKHASAHGVKAI